MLLSTRRRWLATNLVLSVFAVLLGSTLAVGTPRFVEHIIDDNLDGAVHVHPADMDGDGDLDVIACGVDADEIRWYENDGAQGFTAHTVATGVDGAYSVTVADFNGDGHADVASAALFGDSIDLWLQQDDGSFLQQQVENIYNLAHTVELVDMNEDGHPDLLTAGQGAEPVRFYTNDGSGQFSMTPLTGQNFQAQACTPVDIDGDGDLDVVSNSFTNDRFTVYRNDGLTAWTAVLIGNGDGAHWATAADINGDGTPDPITTALYDDQLVWWEEVFAGFYTPHPIDDNLNGAIYCEAADFDMDGDMDVVATAEDAGEIAWYENDELTFTKHLLRDDFAFAGAVMPVDLDGDGDMDILSAAIQADQVVWWELESFEPPTAFAMLSPVDEDTLYRSTGVEFEWGASSDPDPGADPGYALALGLVDGPDTLWVQESGVDGTTAMLDLTAAWPDLELGNYPGVAHVNAISQGDTLRSTNQAEVVIVLDGAEVEEDAGTAPPRFRLAGAYPNPFNASATVAINLATPGRLMVDLHDVTGRKLLTLADGSFGPGQHRFQLNGAGLPSGTYLLRASVPGEQEQTRRVTLVK